MHLLFLCTGNSCRSQMAEGWARHFAHGLLDVQSAGIEAHGKNSWAISVMQDAGIDISQQESTQSTQWADVVVTVCGHADEHYPALPNHTHKIHWPLSDPAKAIGAEADIMTVFRTSRDEFRDRV